MTFYSIKFEIVYRQYFFFQLKNKFLEISVADRYEKRKLTPRFRKWISNASFWWTETIITSKFVFTDRCVMARSAGTIIFRSAAYNCIPIITFMAPAYWRVISRFTISILATNVLYLTRI